MDKIIIGREIPDIDKMIIGRETPDMDKMIIVSYTLFKTISLTIYKLY